MHLTVFDVLSVLPAEWQSKMGEKGLVPVTSGMSGAYVFRILDPQSGDRYLKVGIGTNADQLRREGARTRITPEGLYRRLEAGIPAQEDCVVTHGDATLSNLIFGNDGKIGFVDCGNCGKSNRYVDLAPLFGELADQFGPQGRDMFLETYGRLHWDMQKVEFYSDLYELF
jgi:aminoglycoside phosphotransferase